MEKRGIDSIIATMLLVLLTVVLAGVIWVSINGVVNKNISQSVCYKSYNEVTFNNQYTCYNSSSNQVQFSVNAGNINISGFTVAMTTSNGNESESVTVKNTSQSVQSLEMYNGSTSIAVPGANSGLTYLFSWNSTDEPSTIQIAPILGSQQCPASDSIAQISNCALI